MFFAILMTIPVYLDVACKLPALNRRGKTRCKRSAAGAWLRRTLTA